VNALTYTAAIHSGRVQLVSLRQKSLTVARLRVLLVAAVFVAMAMAAIVRIGFLGVTGSGRAVTSFEDALLPSRGEITDRNGEPLARAFPAFALWYNPQALGEDNPLVRSPQAVAKELAAIFPDIDETELADRLAKGKAGYLRRRVLPEEANKVQAIGELALELPKETDRHYPQGSLGAHVLGYVGADGHGRVGMEAVLDKQLLDPATRGQPIPLSIDVRVQGALEDELTRGMRATNALGSAGIVLDVDTGEVLALASLPEFDPNHIDKAGVANMFNRVTNQVYELGSTFKPLTVAAAIDAGTITDLGRRYSARPYPLSGYTIKDSHDLGASLNTPEMLMHSSNVVTGHIVADLGTKRLKKVLADLGMNERPHIELPARGFPLWVGGDWSLLRGVTVGYGHGISVTPLHLASAYAAMVNGGVWRPATMHKVEPGKAAKGRRVFKASTSAKMNQMLRMIVTYGTGRKANAPGFRVGGKTGSADKPAGGGYNRTSVVATFAAAFPMDRPRYVVIAMLDEPKGTVASSFQRTAAWNAAPVVGRLVPRIGPILGVAPDSSRDVDLSDLAPLVPQSKKP
jgi:cell division protein FtsI (penicillin-binding protein 3)